MNVEDKLKGALGDHHKSSTSELSFNCPQCHIRANKRRDVKKHLYVNVAKNAFFCHRCQWKGSVDYLLKSLGLASKEPDIRGWNKIVKDHRFLSGKDYSVAYELFEIEYPCHTLRPQKGMSAWSYLNRRGVTEEDIDFYQIVCGVGKSWDNRIFFPTYRNNEMVYWVARDFSHDPVIKYINPPHSERRHHVFNLDKAEGYDEVHITEGVFSAIAAGRNGICTFGKYVTSEQVKLLLDADFKTYYVALDGDAWKNADFLAGALHKRGKSVRLVPIPYGEDPDSVNDYQQWVDESVPYTYENRVNFLIKDRNGRR